MANTTPRPWYRETARSEALGGWVASKTECERVLNMIPGIAYSGDRPGAECHTFLIPAMELLGYESNTACEVKP